MTSRIVETPFHGRGFGYQLWRIDQGDLVTWNAVAMSGQILMVVPARDLVVVSLGWNVHDDDSVEWILPALADAALRATAGSR